MQSLHNVNLTKPINNSSPFAKLLTHAWIYLPKRLSFGRWYDFAGKYDLTNTGSNQPQLDTCINNYPSFLFGGPTLMSYLGSGKPYNTKLSPLSVFVAFKTKSTVIGTSVNCLISFGSGQNGEFFSLSVEQGVLWSRNFSSNISCGSNLNDGEWHTVLWRKPLNGTRDSVEIFIDGVKQVVTTGGTNYTLNIGNTVGASNYNLAVGRLQNATTTPEVYFNGRIASILISESLMTSSIHREWKNNFPNMLNRVGSIPTINSSMYADDGRRAPTTCKLIKPSLQNINLQNLVNFKYPLARGLIGWWIGLPKSGRWGSNKLVDIVGKNDGVLNNINPSTSWTSTKYGLAIKTPGTPSYINCGKRVGPSGGFTCAVLHQPNSTSATYSLSSQYSNADGGAYFQLFQFSSAYRFRIHQVRDTTYIGRIGGSVGGTKLIIGTWDGTTSTSGIKIYSASPFSNPVRIDTSDYAAGSFTGSYTGILRNYIGAQDFNGPNASHSGTIWTRMDFSRGLSEIEVKLLVKEVWDMFPNMLNRAPSKLSYSTSSLSGIGGITTVGRTRQALWNLLSVVGKTDSILWNTLLTVGTNRQLLFNIFSKVGQNEQLVWDLLANAGANLQNIWNTYATVSSTSQSIWDVLTLTSKSRQLIWNDYQTAGQSSQSVWDIYAHVTQSRQLVWGVGGFVNTSVGIVYNALQNVSKSNQIDWNTLISVGKPVDILYDIMAAVGKSQQEVWNTRATISQQIEIVYNNLITTNSSSNINWNVAINASSAKQLIFNVLSLANASGELIWDTRGTAAKQTELTWNIIANVRANIDTLWNDYITAGNSVQFEYRLRQVILSSIQKVWDVRALTTAERDILWNTIQLVSLTSIYEIMLNIKTGMSVDVNILQRELNSLDVNKIKTIYLEKNGE